MSPSPPLVYPARVHSVYKYYQHNPFQPSLALIQCFALVQMIHQSILQNLTKDLPNHTQQSDPPIIPRILFISLVNYEALPPLWWRKLLTSNYCKQLFK